MQPRVDADDLVQITMLRACRAFPSFHGSNRQQFHQWLITIHRHTILEELNHQSAAKRSVCRDQSFWGDASLATIYWLEPLDDSPTPSIKLIRAEEALSLARALYKLPPDQRAAVRLRHLEGWSVADIARRLQRSESAAAGLVKRGLRLLRQQLRR
jgi:RNA polymerase sigma-70 factor (ECF subfamily)